MLGTIGFFIAIFTAIAEAFNHYLRYKNKKRQTKIIEKKINSQISKNQAETIKSFPEIIDALFESVDKFDEDKMEKLFEFARRMSKTQNRFKSIDKGEDNEGLE